MPGKTNTFSRGSGNADCKPIGITLIISIGTVLLLGLLAFQYWFAGSIIDITYLPGPVQDSWGLLPFLEKHLLSSWWTPELWLPQNGHRYPWLKLSYLIDYRYFSGSNIFLISQVVLLLMLSSAGFLYFIFKSTLNNQQKVFSALLCLVMLSAPSLCWSLNHVFNLHMIQAACFTALGIAAVVIFGNPNKNLFNPALLLGILFLGLAIFSALILPALVATLFCILFSQQKPLKNYCVLLLLVLGFVSVYFFLLPVNTNDNSQNFSHLFGFLNTETHNTTATSNSTSASNSNAFDYLIFLTLYLFNYLNLPALFGKHHAGGATISSFITLFSLIWFVASFFIQKQNKKQEPDLCLNNFKIYCLAIMSFVLLLAISTAIGRGFIGDLGYGLRFHPFVMLYWAAFGLHLLLFTIERDHYQYAKHGRHDKHDQHNKKDKLHFCLYAISTPALAVFFMGIIFSNSYSAIDTGVALSGDYNRFAKSKTTLLTGNWHENAVYENMVPAWRQHSYPGMITAQDFLQTHKLGIYSNNAINNNYQQITQLFDSNNDADTNKSSKKPDTICFEATVTETPRAQDPQIRNLRLSASDVTANQQYPYLAFYNNEQLMGLAFPAARSPVTKTRASSWLAVSKKPLLDDKNLASDADHNVMIIGLQPETRTLCRVKINNP